MCSALLVVGSQARSDVPADRWSDLDLVLIVDDPEPYAEDSNWVAEFGRPVLTFLEDTPVGQRERRVLYESGEDVDFPLFPVTALELLEQSENVAQLLARGYRVLARQDRARRTACARCRRAEHAPPPTQADFTQLAVRLLVPRSLGSEEAAARRGVHGQGLPRRLHEGPARDAARVACARCRPVGGHLARGSVPRTVGAIRARSPPSRRRTRTTTCATSLARSGETIDLWQGLEEETARRLGLELVARPFRPAPAHCRRRARSPPRL